MGERPVLHAVLRANVPGVVMDLGSGRRTRPYMVLEQWYKPDEGLRERVLESTWVRAPSRVVVEQPASDAYTNIFGAFLRGYKEALRSGDAQIVRRGQIDGREVEWWRFNDRPVGTVNFDVAIDSKTYRPLVTRLVLPGRRPVEWSARVLEIGTVAELPEARSSTGGVAGIDVKQDLTPTQAAGALSKPTLWVGPEHEGLPLAHIKLLEFAQGPGKTWASVNERWRGLDFVYGEVDKQGVPIHGKPFLTLEEQTRPGAPPGAPPEGMVLLVGKGVIMQTNGVYISITASSQELALSAARALSPIPPD
jgi:hypothetical protein